jgi:hypothetical protein
MRRQWIAVLACLAAAGCGSEPQLTIGAAGRLHDAVATVREAAADRDRDGALRALDRLQERVAAAEREGELDAADAAAIRRGITHARARVRREIAPPAPPAATAEPTAEPTAAPDEKVPGKGKAKGKAKKDKPGKGKGH